jgi:DNA-binding FadR family transcriptional regulator
MVDARAAGPHPHVRSTGDELSPWRPRLSERVGAFAADIISRRVAPGTMLATEPQLCDRSDVSRDVVREAVVPAAAGG